MVTERFQFVDVHWEDPNGSKRAPKWRRIPIDDVPEFQQENSNYNVFATVQRFCVKTHTTPEMSYMPLYFDIDHADVAISQVDAKKIVAFFRDLTLEESDIRVYFSGKKGFHILVDAQALGVEPHTELNLLFKFVALYLREHLDLQALDYASIYSSRRMLRLPDSIHQSTGRFKIEITHTELETLTVDEIRELAIRPRGSLHDSEPQLNEVASVWYRKKQREYNEARQVEAESIAVPLEIMQGMDSDPECVVDILTNGLKKAGDRNKATMALASYFKDAGYTQEETERLLLEWVVKIPNEYTSSDMNARRSSTMTAVRTIFSDDKYHFGCAFIRSLKGDGDNHVPCAGRRCPLHEDHRRVEEPAEKLHLSDTADATLTGKKVAFDCLVSGKMDTPYIVPKKVVYTCSGVDSCDKECIMHDFAGRMEKEFHDHDRQLIEVTLQTDAQLRGLLREHSKASCKRVQSHVTEYVNVEELLVVPMAERVAQRDTEDGIKSLDDSGREYVTRKVYLVGQSVPSNQYYEIEGYVYPHPRSQLGTILSQKCEPKQDNVGSFTLTPDIIESFRPFQVQEGETVLDRVNFLLDDLTNNVTRIFQRDEALLAVLLTYHSILSFYFQEQPVQRGWMETVLVGDSGQGKTEIVNTFADFVGLGDLVSGESSSRTGLVYRMEQIGDRWFITWGKYPLNDRKLLAIDELTGLSEEDLDTITEARSTGILKVARIVIAETNSRTRMLMMTNPRGGKQLFHFTYGIECLKGVFREASDIRRLDLAVLLATKDVPREILNQRYEKPKQQFIKADVMKNSILWAWSRKPEDVVFADGTTEEILQQATFLSEKYGCAEDIPLVSPGDQRIKIARMSVALAGLVHSTDETHEKVVVQKEHVQFVASYLQSLFNAKNCRYDEYADSVRDESVLLGDEQVRVLSALEALDREDHLQVSNDVLELFRRNDVLKAQELQDMTGHGREIVNPRLAVLAKYNFLKRTREGFRKMPKFIEFLENVRKQKGA